MADQPSAGGTGADLGELLTAGIPEPDGFVGVGGGLTGPAPPSWPSSIRSLLRRGA